MKDLKYWLLAITFAAATTAVLIFPAYAETLHERLVILNAYVRDATGYKSRELPKVVWKTNEELAAMMQATPCSKSDPRVPCVRAAENEGVIFLVKDWPLPSDILVHELVHFQQFESGKKFNCKGEMEKEAYDVQERFAKEVGVAAEMPGPLMLYLITQCGNPY